MMDQANLKAWEWLRAKVLHEDSWVQQRVSWLLGSTSLLVAGYAVLATVRTDVSIPQTLLRGYLMLLLPAFGFFLSLLVLLGLVGSSLAVTAAIDEWERLAIPEDQRSHFPTLHSRGAALALGRFASRGTCFLLALFWVIVFVLTRYLI